MTIDEVIEQFPVTAEASSGPWLEFYSASLERAARHALMARSCSINGTPRGVACSLVGPYRRRECTGARAWDDTIA